MDRKFIAKHWYASVYEQFENQTYDVVFLLKVLKEQSGGTPLDILEVACGGGRICVPLAQAGYNVTGFDSDEHMLVRCYRKMAGLPNIRCYRADAVIDNWDGGYDVVVMAGNILINIETETDYKEAQRTFIRNAAGALRRGGHLYLDFDLHYDPPKIFEGIDAGDYFEGTDELGTKGRIMYYGSVYNPVTQISSGVNHTEIITNSGERIIISNPWNKHIPTQAQVYEWLASSGFVIENTYRNFTDEPLKNPIDESTERATIWARKD